MFHKIETVQTAGKYRLLVRFACGEQRQYDVAPLMERWPSFQALATVENLFEQVRADPGGYGISWNDELDLSCDELWYNGSAVPNGTNERS